MDTTDGARLDRLMAEIDAVRESGLAYDREENAPGISAVGTAFQLRTGQIYALAVPTPADRFAEAEAAIGRCLLTTRRQLLAATGAEDGDVDRRRKLRLA